MSHDLSIHVAYLTLLTLTLYVYTYRHFFELIRFDFFIDNNLKVWLMEVCERKRESESERGGGGEGRLTILCPHSFWQVNLSPNLSSGHTHRNRFMYEQVLPPSPVDDDVIS